MPKREFTISQQSVTITPAMTIQATDIVVEMYNDDGVQINCLLSFKLNSGVTMPLVLWDAANYPSSTPSLAQIRNRIKSLLNVT